MTSQARAGSDRWLHWLPVVWWVLVCAWAGCAAPMPPPTMQAAAATDPDPAVATAAERPPADPSVQAPSAPVDGEPRCQRERRRNAAAGWDGAARLFATGEGVSPQAFSHVSRGESHACGILSSGGGVRCWGPRSFWLAEPPEGVVLKSVSVGRDLACGLEPGSGHAVCWLNPLKGGKPVAVAPPGVSFTSVSVGAEYACGVRAADAQVQCWGKEHFGRTEPPAGVRFLQVSAGYSQTCGVRAVDQRVECWGWGWDRRAPCAIGPSADDPGQCAGHPDFRAPNPPADVKFERVSVGYRFACGIRSEDRTAMCWGSEEAGQTAPPADAAFVRIDAGMWHACGVRAADAAVQCWRVLHGGGVDCGGSTPPSNAEFREVSAGTANTCAIRKTDGRVQCWGDNIPSDIAEF